MAVGVLTHGQISSTSLTTILTVGGGQSQTIGTFTLTNETASEITVTVFANMSSSDRRVTKVVIPAGIGESIQAVDAMGSYSQLDVIKLQAASSDTFNYLLTGRTASV